MKNFDNYINENKNISFDTIASLVINGNLNLVKDFLNSDKDNVNLRNNMGETLLMVSLNSKTPDMFYLLLEYDPVLTFKELYNGDTILHKIIEDYRKIYKLGITDAIHVVIKKEPFLLKIKNKIGYTPLYDAALYSVYALFEILKFNPDWEDYKFLDLLSDNIRDQIIEIYPDKAREYRKKIQINKFKI